MAARTGVRTALTAILMVMAALPACTHSSRIQETASMQEPRSGAPVIIAHRGASGLAPEHTFTSWDLALAAGADYLEQDLQMTRDGVLVVLHDEELDRTARGPVEACTGPVRERTLEDLRRCEVGGWFDERFAGEPVPTLEEVLERYAGRARFYIETKSPEEAPGMEEALVDALAEHDLLGGGSVILQSFSAASLRRLEQLAPELPRVQLVAGRTRTGAIRGALAGIAAYADGIGPAHRRVTADLVRDAHANGLFVHPYTVNDTARMEALWRLGVDGMFTDRPDLLRRLLDSGSAR